MKNLIKTKLIDENHVEVRDYELHQQPLKIIHCTALDYKFCNHDKCEFMLLSLVQQKKGKFLNTQQSKFPPYKYYGIYKFLWKPQKPSLDLDEHIDIGAEMASHIDNNRESWEALRAKLHPKMVLDKQNKRV